MRFEDEMEKKWQTLLNVLNRLIGFFRVFVTSWSEWIENCTGWMSKCISGNGGKAETRWIGTSLSIWFLTFDLSMSIIHVIKWCLWVILIDLECLKWKWTTSHSLPISSYSCSSWHVNSFEMALWKVKKWDMFIHSIVWVPASSDMIVIRETVETRRNCHIIFHYLQFVMFLWMLDLTDFNGRPSFCSVLYCCTGLTGRRTEGRRWEKRPREEDRFTTNKLRTQSGRIWDLLLILDGGSGDKLYNPSYFALLCFVLNNE